MKDFLDKIKGYKTQIIFIAIGFVYTLQLFGVVDTGTAEKIITYLAALGGITLAAKVNRVGGVK